MSKELPYFKFHCDQWLGKKITLESYELQGVFINVCAIYWANDCDIKIATLTKRYGDAILSLIDEGFIKDKNGVAKINFLDSQWQERYKIHKKNSDSGRAGALVRWAKHSEANSDPNGVATKNGIAIRKDKKRKDINEVFMDEKYQLPYEIINGEKIVGSDNARKMGGMSVHAIKIHCQNIGVEYGGEYGI